MTQERFDAFLKSAEPWFVLAVLLTPHWLMLLGMLLGYVP